MGMKEIGSMVRSKKPKTTYAKLLEKDEEDLEFLEDIDVPVGILDACMIEKNSIPLN